MRSYLDFEKPVAELEAKVEELRALQTGETAVAIGEEIARLEAKAAQALKDLYIRSITSTRWSPTSLRSPAIANTATMKRSSAASAVSRARASA